MKTRQNYEQRVYRIQDYICSRLDRELRLENLASISSFSPFHFHRIFKSVTRETPYDFIRRKRLERSCAMLSADMSTKILEVALCCGFSTASSFAKSFRSHFRISPSEYRKRHFASMQRSVPVNSKNGTPDSNPGKDSSSSIEYLSDAALADLYIRRKKMKLNIEDIPQYRIAYIRQIGPYGSSNIQLMQKLKKWAISRNLITQSSIILGIAHDDPKVTPAENCRYDTGIVLTDGYTLESGINESILPGGKYAVFSTEHTVTAIEKLWDEIFSAWLPNSGYRIDERPIFERYAVTTHDISIAPSRCEICVPVKVL